MASHSTIATNSIDLRRLISWLFSLATLIAMSASAAYTNCTTNPLSGITTDCFSLDVQPQVASLASPEIPYDIALVTANSALALPTNHEHSPITPTAQGSGFYVNQHHPSGEQLPESLPLVLLIATLLAVFLVRAKSINNK